MITAIVTEKGQPIPTVISQQIGILTEEHTKILADAHKIELDKAIEDSRVRPVKEVGNHLKDQIAVEKIDSGYGVGNVETLNQKAPWWVWINFGRAGTGRTSPPSDIGSFSGTPIPTGGTSKGIWQHLQHALGGRMYYLAPNKDIQAHNYIEKALGVMIGKVRELIKS